MTTSQDVHDALDKLGRTALRVKVERDELLEALKGIMFLIEKGELVRSTADDHKPGWAIKQIPFVVALKMAQDAIDRAESGKCPHGVPRGHELHCSVCGPDK